MRQRLRIALLLLSAFTLSLPLAPEARCSENHSQRQKTEYGLTYFQKSLVDLAKNNKVYFVIEGEPYSLAISKIKTLDISRVHRLDDSVQQIADAYDYSVIRHGNLFLLRKKYTYPQEMPTVTREECYAAINAFHNMLVQSEAFRVSQTVGKNRPFVRALFQNLTSEQRDRLRNGSFLRISSDCSPEVVSKAKALLLEKYLSNIDMYSSGSGNSLSPDNPISFAFKYEGGAQIPGYYRRGFLPTSREFSSLDVSYSMTAPKSDTDPTMVTTNYSSGLKIPEYDDKPIAISLEQAMLRLNKIAGALPTVKQSKTEGSDATHFVVEEALKSKPVTLIGDNSTVPPARLASAIAELYGLSIRHDTSVSETITLPATPRLAQETDIALALRATMPLPLFDALHIAEEEQLTLRKSHLNGVYFGKPDPYAAPSFEIDPPLKMIPRIVENMYRRLDEITANRKTLMYEAKWQLEDSVIKLLGNGTERTTKEIPFADVSQTDKSRFTVLALETYIERVCRDMHTPLYLTRFHDLCLTCTPTSETYGGPSKVDLNFQLYDPQKNEPGLKLVGWIGADPP